MKKNVGEYGAEALGVFSAMPGRRKGGSSKLVSAKCETALTSFPAMRLFTGMWLTMATTGKPNAY